MVLSTTQLEDKPNLRVGGMSKAGYIWGLGAEKIILECQCRGNSDHSVPEQGWEPGTQVLPFRVLGELGQRKPFSGLISPVCIEIPNHF